jgi:SHAQKYF class myb-like DNA-binding protein
MKHVLGGDSVEAPHPKRLLREKTKRSNYIFFSDSILENEAKGNRNGRWTLEEHQRFIEGVFKFGNNWKGIAEVIKTRTCPQARSHGQKFFSKLMKIQFEGLEKENMNVRDLHDMALVMSRNNLEKLKFNLIQAHARFEKMYIENSQDEDFELKNQKNQEISIEYSNLMNKGNEKKSELNLVTNNLKSNENSSKKSSIDKFENVEKKKISLKKSSTMTTSAGKEYTDHTLSEDDLEKININPNYFSFGINKESKERIYSFSDKTNYSPSPKRDLYYEMMKNRISTYAQEKGEINEAVKICGRKILENITKQTHIDEIIYNNLYHYQDEVCLENFTKG